MKFKVEYPPLSADEIKLTFETPETFKNWTWN